VLIITLLILGIGHFLIPIHPLENTVSPEELADPDSKFVDIHNIRVHYKSAGKGTDTLLLLHGFGANTFTWSKVVGSLSDYYTVIAYDRTGFGLTSRPMPGEWSGESPYSAESQADQAIALMDTLGIDKVVLIGNSAGGTIATLIALRYPERVKALILEDAAIYREGPPYWLYLIVHTPQVKRLGPLILREVREHFTDIVNISHLLTWHDPSRQTPEIIEGYNKYYRVKNWDRALWELTLAYRPLHLEERLYEIEVPVLVITGEDDRIVPQEESVRVARKIPHAELMVISYAGHLPHEETPEEFFKVVNNFIKNLSTTG
jgi:pimeloyl-ACP methyl ester carboxylesterase